MSKRCSSAMNYTLLPLYAPNQSCALKLQPIHTYMVLLRWPKHLLQKTWKFLVGNTNNHILGWMTLSFTTNKLTNIIKITPIYGLHNLKCSLWYLKNCPIFRWSMTQCLCIAKWNFNCLSVNNRIVNCYCAFGNGCRYCSPTFVMRLKTCCTILPSSFQRMKNKSLVWFICSRHLYNIFMKNDITADYHFLVCLVPLSVTLTFLAVTNDSALWALWFQFLTKLLQNVNKSITSKYLQM